MDYLVLVLVAGIIGYFVVRNNAAKVAEVKAHADHELEKVRVFVKALEAHSRAYSDELWDEAKAVQVKVAELIGKVGQ